jgi:23S rRNA pseudouridine955/2504/2580 synthase/23S rRNA pseudouridine1911/1915/1917 synthase
VSLAIKLSAPATAEFWETPVLYEDAHLLALNKPAGLLVSPDNSEPERPSLMPLLHAGIARGTSWARERGLSYLRNAHRLDAATSGILLLAKDKPTLVALAAQFGSSQPGWTYAALARGAINESSFVCEAKLAPHPLRLGFTRVDLQKGRASRTEFSLREKFSAGYLLLECQPQSSRPHQIAAHLKHLRLPLVGDEVYGGAPLWLSSLKSGYRLKPGQTERPLLSRPALHAEQLICRLPGQAENIKIEAPWAKDLTVAIKYLRRFGV